jgi:hypothetical protein
MAQPAARNGASNATVIEYQSLYAQQRRRVEEETGILRALLKRAKSDGVNTRALTTVHLLAKQDPDQVRLELREQVRYMALRNMPVQQQDLFDVVPVRPAPEAGLHAAEQGGYDAGRAGGDVDDSPFDAGTALDVEWRRGWHRGQEFLARQMAVRGEDDKPAEGGREHPRRRRRQEPQEATPGLA